MWDPGWDTKGKQEYEVQTKEISINGGGHYNVSKLVHQ